MTQSIPTHTINIPTQQGLVLLSEMVRQNAIAKLCNCRPGWITEKKNLISSISSSDTALFNSILVPLSDLILGLQVNEDEDVATQKSEIKRIGRVVALPYVAESLGMTYYGTWSRFFSNYKPAKCLHSKRVLTVDVVRGFNKVVTEIGLRVRSLHFV